MSALGAAPLPFAILAPRRCAHPVTISNVPGPQGALYRNGARLDAPTQFRTRRWRGVEHQTPVAAPMSRSLSVWTAAVVPPLLEHPDRPARPTAELPASKPAKPAQGPDFGADRRAPLDGRRESSLALSDAQRFTLRAAAHGANLTPGRRVIPIATTFSYKH